MAVRRNLHAGGEALRHVVGLLMMMMAFVSWKLDQRSAFLIKNAETDDSSRSVRRRETTKAHYIKRLPALSK